MSMLAIPVRQTPQSRSILLLLLGFAAGTVLSGCASFRGMMAGRYRDPMAGAPRLQNTANPQMNEIVAHLNQNTHRIHGWRANSVRIEAHHLTLSGTLAVEKGNHVRLVVSSPLGKEVDLGSNDERFWVWSRRPDPAFVTCRHENIDCARQQLGIPFEPQWLMQALGVEPLSDAGMKMEVDPTRRQARLVEIVMSAHGRPLRRAVLVDLKNNGIVLEHSLYNYDGLPLARARLSRHSVESADGVVLPHRVVLDWPQQQMSMTMDLGKIQVNPQSMPSGIWDMPDSPGFPVVHLDSGVPPNRIAIHPDSAARLNSDEIAPNESDAEYDDLPPEQEFNRPLDRSGRARLLEEDDEFVPPVSADDDWAR